MDNPAKVEYMIFPRMEALSEILWTGKGNRNWESFEPRLLNAMERYKKNKINYSKAYFDLKTSVKPAADRSGLLWQLDSKFGDAYILYMSERSPQLKYKEPIAIKSSGIYTASLYNSRNVLLTTVSQPFNFNLATGKDIKLLQEPSSKYPGDGAFTLVNGVINQQGMARSKEFLGYSGKNCEAIIDLGSSQNIKEVVVHALDQKASWIWRPLTAEVLGSTDGQTWNSLKLTDDWVPSAKDIGKGTMNMRFAPTSFRFLKVVVSNWGSIPDDNPGAGNKSWLFVDEIEVR
jgi:hexosaminidase